jgi:HAD superfamily hydrolase (TIGR01450 family)
MHLKNKKFFLLDKDGTLSLGSTILDGTLNFIQALRDANIQFAVATNNSSKTGAKHLESLNAMGLDFTDQNMIVSLDVAIDYLQSHNIQKLFWVANQDVSDYLETFFDYCEKSPDAILVTFDTELNYEKLLTLTDLLHTDIPYYVTHSDIVCPTETHDIPDVGTFVKMMEMTAGRLPDISFGKPSRYYIDYIKKRYKVEEKDMVIVGDRLYTDIKLAEGNEITSILVLSGETSIETYQNSNIKADIIVDGVRDIIKLITGES